MGDCVRPTYFYLRKSWKEMNKEKHTWIAITLGSILLSPLLFIGGIILGSNTDVSHALSSDSMSSWVSAAATLAIAILTFILAKETWNLRISQMQQVEQIRKDSIRPSVELYFLPSPVAFQFINVHVENNGRGVARSIKFTFRPEGKESFTPAELDVISHLENINMLKSGLSSLGSGKSRSSFVFSFLDLSKVHKDKMFEVHFSVSLSFEDADGIAYISESIIDFSEYIGVTEIGGGDPTYQLFQETKKIREILQRVQGNMSSGRFNVNLFTSEDRDKEREAIRKEIEEARKSEESRRAVPPGGAGQPEPVPNEPPRT
ncbi:hypothetical protein [Caenispirillum bisanense]|nr:hypothetical protein [Caenispirillum bisanense]